MVHQSECCNGEKGPKKCAQVGSLTGSALSREVAVAQATVNARKTVQLPNGAPCSDCVNPCNARGITGFTDPVSLAKASIVAQFKSF